MRSGVFGEMMLTYFRGHGSAGVVIDGCIHDWPKVEKIDFGFWIRGVTPNFHTQTDLVPFAVHGSIACGGTLVMPGDHVVAHDDGSVIVPAAWAERVVAEASRQGAGRSRVPAPRRQSPR